MPAMIANVSPLVAELLARPRPVTIGLAGAGQMGTDIVVQVGLDAGPSYRAGAMLTYENCVPDAAMVVTQILHRLDESDTRFLAAAE